MVFEYPRGAHTRGHGPAGYKSYESYRPWLRDDFHFRCVFCMRREQWGLVLASWDIDHFLPQSAALERALDYENLLYVCRTCNLLRSDSAVIDPCRVGLGELVEVDGDGVIRPLNSLGAELIQILRLDNHGHTRFGRMILRILSAAKHQDPEAYAALVGYPENLPDLGQLTPPGGNSRPEGIRNSCFVRRARGELPETY